MENMKCEGPMQLLNDRIGDVDDSINTILNIAKIIRGKLFGERPTPTTDGCQVECGTKPNTDSMVHEIEDKVHELGNLLGEIADRI